MNDADSGENGEANPVQDDTQALHELNKKLTEELRFTSAELETFAYSVSHDLRAPLRSIMGALMVVDEDYGEKIGGEGRKELARAMNAAKRMAQLLEDVLQFSRLARKEMSVKTVDLSDLAEAVGRELGIGLNEAGEPILAVEPNLEAVADPTLLGILIRNLLDNARKFSRNNRQARIEVSRADSEHAGGFVVSDNGIGFDPQYAHKLFIPFEHIHGSEYSGTGLGLANVKRIVTRHGGAVWAEGEMGKGAKFGFTLASSSADECPASDRHGTP